MSVQNKLTWQKNYGSHMITCSNNIAHVNCCTCSYVLRQWTECSDDCVFYKIKMMQLPCYLYELMPKSNQNYNTWNFDHIDPQYCRTDIENPFFPYTFGELNKLDANLKMLGLTCVLEVFYLKLTDQFKIEFLRFVIHSKLNF